MFVTIINDCRDENAAGRQCTRATSLFGTGVNFIGVGSDIEASGNLIDTLDASEGREGVVLVNVAPRNGDAHHFQNGTPFGYFYYHKTLVVSSVSGYTLSFVKQFGIINRLKLMDISVVLKAMVSSGKIEESLVDRIRWSQFRSFDFLPRVARWITDGAKIPTEDYNLDEVPALRFQVWGVDCFGNIKTSILPEDIKFEEKKKITTSFGSLECYKHLRDVPDNHAALTLGSSGLQDKRLVEIAIQGGNAAERFHAKVGDIVLESVIK